MLPLSHLKPPRRRPWKSFVARRRSPAAPGALSDRGRPRLDQSRQPALKSTNANKELREKTGRGKTTINKELQIGKEVDGAVSKVSSACSQAFHAAFPGLVRVEKDGSGYRWIPAIWNASL